MKRTLLFVATLLCVSSFDLGPTAPEETADSTGFAYSFGSLEVETGRVKQKLEQSTALLQKPKGKASSSSYSIAGAKSAVRLKLSETFFSAVSDASTGNLNPEHYITLYRLTAERSTRSYSVPADGSTSAMLVPITIQQVGGLEYRITVNTGLVPGEYAFVDKSTTTSAGSVTVSTFGID